MKTLISFFFVWILVSCSNSKTDSFLPYKGKVTELSNKKINKITQYDLIREYCEMNGIPQVCLDDSTRLRLIRDFENQSHQMLNLFEKAEFLAEYKKLVQLRITNNLTPSIKVIDILESLRNSNNDLFKSLIKTDLEYNSLTYTSFSISNKEYKIYYELLMPKSDSILRSVNFIPRTIVIRAFTTYEEKLSVYTLSNDQYLRGEYFGQNLNNSSDLCLTFSSNDAWFLDNNGQMLRASNACHCAGEYISRFCTENGMGPVLCLMYDQGTSCGMGWEADNDVFCPIDCCMIAAY